MAFVQPTFAQSPLNPAGWSDLYTQSRDVGFWINGQRICGVQYDPAKLAREVAMIAKSLKVSVKTLESEGQKRAAEAAPFVTKESCQFAKKQAVRLDMLPGKPRRTPRDIPPPSASLGQ
jgi:hypothetical protein